MVTVRELSAAVGVSPAMVSRVLNFNAALPVSAQVRRAIIETAEAMNFETSRDRNHVAAARQAGDVLGHNAYWHF